MLLDDYICVSAMEVRAYKERTKIYLMPEESIF
jgi:hypothetical protein